MKNVMGIDVGTSGLKVVLLDENMQILDQAYAGYNIESDVDGTAEQNPYLWWQALETCVDKMDLQNVVCVGLSGQMHGLVALDKERNIAHNAILWCDARSVKEAEKINKLQNEKRVYNRVSSGYLVSSLMWLREKKPHIYRKLDKVMLPKDFLGWMLTGRMGTDFLDATGSGVLDLENMDWDRDLLKELEISPDLFVDIGASYEIRGYVNRKLGNLPFNIPVIYGSGDHGMQLIGAEVYSEELLSLNIGTSCQLSGLARKPTKFVENSLYIFPHPCSPLFSITGTGYNGGIVFKWLKNTFCPTMSFEELCQEAEQSPAGSRGVIFLPYINGERGRENLSGNICGLRLYTKREDVIRAALEGITYRVKDYMEELNKFGITGERIVLSGGASKSKFWIQLIADILNRPVQVSSFEEQAATGAAILAGKSCNLFAEKDKKTARIEKCIIEPRIMEAEQYSKLYLEYRRTKNMLFEHVI